jgi:hypothetical protein
VSAALYSDGGASRAITRAREAAANPPNGEARESVDVVDFGFIDEEIGVATAYLGNSRFINIMWCPKRRPMASLPRVHRTIVETLDAKL